MQRVIEALESRIAPAAVFTYTESDGDTVTVKTTAKVSNEYFENLALYDLDGNLAELNLTDSVFRNTSLTVTVSPAAPGGKASIGHIEAEGIDLKNVIIDGDLGSIEAGDYNRATPGLTKLQVNNLGGSGEGDSFLSGGAKTVKILGDLVGDLYTEGGSFKTITISGSVGEDGDIGARKIGTLFVGGDMNGEVDAGTINSVRIVGGLLGTYEENGTITADIIRSVRIGGDIGVAEVHEEFTIGAGGIQANVIGSVVVGGDIRGGGDSYTGFIFADYDLGKVTVKGSVIGGSGFSSGVIGSGGDAGLIRIGGNLVAGEGDWSGSIALVYTFSDYGEEPRSINDVEFDPNGVADKIVIGGSILGTGVIPEIIDPQTLQGRAIEFTGEGSGAILAGGIGSLRVGGNVEGGSGYGSGSVYAYDLGSTNIGGSILGGSGEYSAAIGGDGIGSIRVTGDVLGGQGQSSASIVGYFGIGSVKIGGRLGGDADGSGSIAALYGAIDSITIGNGMSNTGSGLTGIYAENEIGRVTITGDVAGGVYGTLGIRAGYEATSAFVPSIGSVSIKGSATNFLIQAGVDIDAEFYGDINDGINADASIGSVNITGNLVASSIVAGVEAGADGIFGTADDNRGFGEPDVYSRIANVVIGGTVDGTPAATNALDGYGIVAEHIVAAKINGTKVALNSDAFDDTIAQFLGTEDFRIVELSALV